MVNSGAYFNELDPFACGWLENLQSAGVVVPGFVDDRTIHQVQPEDVHAAAQAHFFAGIGVWSHALRLAGWPDDVPVWTGSCPCQPFSVAGKGRGTDDERHLWPEWFRLIRECRPPVVFGEQVASPAGRAWFDAVSADLEGVGYACGAADLCAASVGAPHIRQRLFFVAVADEGRCWPQGLRRDGGSVGRRREGAVPSPEAPHTGEVGAISDTACHRRTSEGQWTSAGYAHRLDDIRREQAATQGFWADAEWVLCRDGKARALEPGTCPVADGAPTRMGTLRAYGNAIVPQVAAAFIASAMDVFRDLTAGVSGEFVD